MKRLLKSPLVNALFLSLFSVFYALVFLLNSKNLLSDTPASAFDRHDFWSFWRGFLLADHHLYLVYLLFVVTAVVVLLLFRRRHDLDEYQTSVMINCFIVALALVLSAIALFYLLIVTDPTALPEKFTLFILIHWATVVFADLFYVLLAAER